ncbi:hypothetical protein AHF37_01520 [Paragonimus kellicotti]|nr:hypothetical protein AHF37_01520 [Paragonimus kellicotti]
METTELHNGYNIPNLFCNSITLTLLCFLDGTYKVFDELLPCLDAALGAGYRGIDTAAYYHNERRIGEALKFLMPKYNLHRRDLFLSTKLRKMASFFTCALH